MNHIAGLVIFFGLGLFFGWIMGVSFIRFDNLYGKIISSAGPTVLLGLFIPTYESMGFDTDSKSSYYALFLTALLITFAATYYILLGKLKDLDGSVVLRPIDIIMGKNDIISTYYRNREKKLEILQEVSELESRKSHLENDAIRLDDALGERDRALKAKESQLSSINDRIKENLSERTVLEIPLSDQAIFDNQAARQLPDKIERLAEFGFQLRTLTLEYTEYIKEVKKIRPDESTMDRIEETYFVLVLSYLLALFGNSHGVRVHARKYDSNTGLYVKIAAYTSEEEYSQPMRDIPCNEGMIYHANKCRRSLVKSSNPTLHYHGSKDQIWEDYITIPLTSLNEDGYPIYSLGVSVKNEATHRDFLCFLSFIKIEQIIDKSIELIYKVIISSDQQGNNSSLVEKDHDNV